MVLVRRCLPLFVLFFCASNLWALDRPIFFDFPQGGELFVPGTTTTIRQKRRFFKRMVRIELSRDGGLTWELVGDIDNTVRPTKNRYKLNWVVTGPETSDAVLRAMSLDPKRPGQGLSASFSIGQTAGSLPSGLDHGNLAGLADDDHPQYLRTDGTRTLTGNQSAGGNKITNVAAPTANADAANKQYVDGANTAQDTAQAATDAAQDTAIAAKVAKAGGTMTGPLTLSGDPTANLHAATKQYVDGAVAAGTAVWKTGGNAGTTAGTHFLGTTDNQALEIKVFGQRVTKLIPGPLGESPSIIVGSPANSIAVGIRGATISGGGNPNPGWENKVTDNWCTVGGGSNNNAGNGDGNLDNARHATVAGGWINTASGFASTVGGGERNQATLNHAAVGGGISNTASGDSSTVSGGRSNIASGIRSTISGGFNNQATTQNAAIGGGSDNIARGLGNAVVGGGINNTSSGGNSTVSGGISNIASGDGSMIPGGRFNVAQGLLSFAAGNQAKALHGGAFVWGDATMANVASTAINQFTVRASGGVRFFSNAALSAGVTLAPGGTSWTAVSDRNKKKNFRPLDGEVVLEKIEALPVTRWNYTWEADDSVPHIGPMAQDFKKAFYPGRDDKTISTLEFDGVEMAAVKALESRTKRLKEKNAELKVKNTELEGRLAKLEAFVRSLADDAKNKSK